MSLNNARNRASKFTATIRTAAATVAVTTTLLIVPMQTANATEPDGPTAAATSARSTTQRGQHHNGHDRKHGHKHKHPGHPSFRARALHVAAAQKGDPYVYGADGPNAFDCSGLTSYSFARVGHHLPRTSAAQRGATRRIAARDARPGDLVFFYSGGRVTHVGVYAGHHSVVHAPYPGTRVRKERIWTSAVSYGRVR